MKTQSFIEVMERFHKGEKMDEQAFDMRLFKAVDRLKKKYDIRYDPDNPVPSDMGMADRCFEAARELYAEVGTYCLDTNKVAQFTIEEMDAAIVAASEAITLGEGNESVVLHYRSVNGNTPVFVLGGLQTLLFSDEEISLAVYRACCRSRAVDGVVGGIVPYLKGNVEVKADSPLEVFPYRRSAVLLRQAAAEAGRQGMLVTNGAPKSSAHIAMYACEDGLRRTDAMGTGGVPELKTTFDRLQRVSFALTAGIKITAGLGAMIGGFSGSVEGAAIVAAAGIYQSLLVNKAEVVLLTATPVQTQSRSTRKGIWVSSLALQAMGRNTKVILACANGDHPAAGPGTEQYFLETAAGAISGVVSGGHSLGGTRKFKTGSVMDYGSPVESEFLGRVCRAAVGMNCEQANYVVKRLLERYENGIKDAPAGYTLHEIYDLNEELPKPMYRRIYDGVAADLRAMGVRIGNYGENEV